MLWLLLLILQAILYTGVYINGYPSGVDNDQGNIRGQGPSGVLAGVDTNLWSKIPSEKKSDLF